MVISAGIDVLEFAGLVIMPLRVLALEQKAFDFVGGVEGVAFLPVQIVGEQLENAANIGAVRSASLIDDVAEHQHFARSENVGGRPVERAPVDAQPQVALPLRREAANG